MDFKTLKKTSNEIERLTKEIDKMNKGGDFKSSKDERFWRLDIDKSGKGYAVIRFLPAPFVDGDEGLPWVKTLKYGFKGPAGWYIENARATIGLPDPMQEFNSKLWNTNPDSKDDLEKRQAKKQKRKLSYISNILVINDSLHPENNGKTFLFRYGVKIFNKIMNALHPEFPDKKELSPYNLWTGANFVLKATIVKIPGSDEQYPNYDESYFDTPTAILDTEDAREKLWKTEHSLLEFLDPKNFEDYEVLKKKVMRVCQVDENFDSTNNQQTVQHTPVTKPRSTTNKPRTVEDTVPKKSTYTLEETVGETEAGSEDEEWKLFEQLAKETA